MLVVECQSYNCLSLFLIKQEQTTFWLFVCFLILFLSMKEFLNMCLQLWDCMKWNTFKGSVSFLLSNICLSIISVPLQFAVIPYSADCCYTPYFSSLTDLDSSEDDDDNENVVSQKEVARMLVLKHLHLVVQSFRQNSWGFSKWWSVYGSQHFLQFLILMLF